MVLLSLVPLIVFFVTIITGIVVLVVSALKFFVLPFNYPATTAVLLAAIAIWIARLLKALRTPAGGRAEARGADES